MKTVSGRLYFAVLFFLLGAASVVKGQEKLPGIGSVVWSPARVESGSPIFIKIETDQPVTALRGIWLKHDLTFQKAGTGNSWYALAGVDVEQQPGKYSLELTSVASDGHEVHSTQEVTVQPSSYKTTTLHVEQKYVAPDAATQQQIAADKVVKDAAFAHLAADLLWTGSFRSPVPFTATDSFGTRRMFNGQLASVHRGTDFHAPSGTAVAAANDGVVIIAAPMFYEGNLVVIDHGGQFTTLYMHLSKIEVNVGDHVNRGQRLGLSGATGRVTGPHLHFAARWQGMYVDPVILFGLKLPPR